MEMSSEISTLRDYFTLIDKEIICDFCHNSYDIIIKKEDVRNHLNESHENYKNAVSSKTIQEDLKKFYTINNNTIKCEHCEQLYISWNAHCIITNHLGVGHLTDEDKVQKICEWIREKYKLNESDGKQYCNICQEGIQNKAVYLITHLGIKHQDENYSKLKPSERKSNKLDVLFDKWMWDFFRRDGEDAYCSFCSLHFKYLVKNNGKIKKHIENEHKSIEYVPPKGSSPSKTCQYSEIQDDQALCKICNEKVEITFTINPILQKHLEKEHKINCAHSEILRKWLLENIKKLEGFQKSECKICNTILQRWCFFELIEHLKSIHNIDIPPEISSMGESSNSGSLLRSDENVKNISIFSMNPQAGTSKSSGIDVRDVDCDRDNTMGNLKRKLSSLSSSDKNVIDVATPSMVPQAGSSKDLDTDDRDSGMKKVKYDDDNRPPDELTSLSSNPVNFHELMTDIDFDIPVPTDKGAANLNTIDINTKKK